MPPLFILHFVFCIFHFALCFGTNRVATLAQKKRHGPGCLGAKRGEFSRDHATIGGDFLSPPQHCKRLQMGREKIRQFIAGLFSARWKTLTARGDDWPFAA